MERGLRASEGGFARCLEVIKRLSSPRKAHGIDQRREGYSK